ncbi:CoA transferase [Pseudopontixanthobacter vadosimaris]|uniref:CoA transferase n=1 Tax=Pseudopontixanthobacter vadosimaris TaxID=2726450 RepID=UPI001472C901|nr:CoA transferase [Pseudopontixanthobacter vadosimaris]
MQDMLSNLSIIEASSFVASPTAGLYCAQLGADVVRVDQIGGGPDFTRYHMTDNGHSLAWENLNRGKRSVALDLRSGEGRELLVELARKTGQLITNFPQNSFLSHDAVAQGDSEMITVRIMGWADGAQAMDFTVNAAVGFPYLTGKKDQDGREHPINHALPAWDLLTGAYSAFALLAAIRKREAGGGGGEIRVPLGDVAIGTVGMIGGIAEVLYQGGDRSRQGNDIWGAWGRDFITSDGERIMLAALTSKQWNAVVSVLDIAAEVAEIEAKHGVEFAPSDHNRYVHRDELFALVEPRIAARTSADVLAALEAAGATFSRYRTPYEAACDPQLVTANPLFGQSPPNPSGFDYPANGAFAHQAGESRRPPAASPRNGQHTEQVLAERLGLSSGAIGDLIDRNIAHDASQTKEPT